MNLAIGRRVASAALLVLAAGIPCAFALQPGRALTQYVHRIWQNQQGLPDGAILEIFQARNGYLWLGMQNGLVRFDGVRFTPVERIIPSAPAQQWVRHAFEDESGTIWMGTNDAGVYAVRPSGTVHYSAEQGLPADLAQCMIPGKGGIVWVCTDSGLARIDPNAEKDPIRVYRVAEGLAGNRQWTACEDDKGVLWAGGDEAKLSILAGDKITVRRLAGLPITASVRAMLCDGDVIWAGTTNGLIRIQGNQEKLYTPADGLVDGFVLALAKGAENTLWIGTRNGFSRLRGETFDSFRPQDGLSQSTAQSMFEDREGSLWVGTKRGLNQFITGRSVPYTVTEGLPSNEAGPILEDSKGIIWAGTLNAGLARFDGQRFTSITVREGLLSNEVLALAGDGDSLWVGTALGLNRIRQGRVEAGYTTANGLPANEVRSVFRDRSGVIWAGTVSGVAALRGGAFVRDATAPRDAIRAIAQDREGRIVVATENSVYRAEAGGFRDLQSGDLYLRNATALYLDPEGYLWVGLNGAGLRLIDGDKITSYWGRDGLFDGEIYGVAGDDRRLWMNSSRGLFWVMRRELHRFAAGEIRRVNTNAYTPTDSLRVIEGRLGVQPSIAMTRDGWLWFSTIRGFISFDTKLQNREAPPPPPVVIENPIVDGQAEIPERISQLPAGQRNIEFNYAGLSYILPGTVRYRYRLIGYDKDWINAGFRREAFYTNLPPGKYRFEVMVACAPGATCENQPTAVEFALAPRFYQRAWFWPAVAVLLGLVAWLGYKLHIRRLRERYDLIVAERSRIARELHDTLIQGFSGITMALQALAGRLRTPEDRETLEDIIADAARCLRETRQSVAGLRAVKGQESGLAAAIARAVKDIAETKDVRLKLKLDREVRPLPAEVEYNLLRIASEAVSNSLKHSGANTIEVELEEKPDAVFLSVKDDGSGFAGEAGVPGAGHYGLIGMKERAAQIGADLELTSQPGAGTRISVVVPAGKFAEAMK